jgi:hypothetical protein
MIDESATPLSCIDGPQTSRGPCIRPGFEDVPKVRGSARNVSIDPGRTAHARHDDAGAGERRPPMPAARTRWPPGWSPW